MQIDPKQEWSEPKHRQLSLPKIKVSKGVLLELFCYSVVSEGEAKIPENVQEEETRKCQKEKSILEILSLGKGKERVVG